MKSIKLYIILIFSICVLPVNAEISFNSTAKKQYYEDLTDKEFVSRLKQTKGFLEDFQKLTERYLKERYGKKYHSIYSRKGVKGIGNTGWEMQVIGFSNIPTMLSGSFLKKRYEIALLEFQLAKYKLKNSEINREQLKDKKKRLKKVEQEMKYFIDNHVNYEE
ncbi:MAG: hypothetical protein GY714_29495 [Desulfobacterales bacterium]|nr:hypothetical protein [Desulfobacterales bacterium]MCP4162239.1 hypothetical protein [Deltaproteobacteria bacterium]